MRRESLLVLTLTRRCDRRCPLCPQAFAERDMAPAVLDAAVAGLAPRLTGARRVKLFGGEPLLRPDLVERALRSLRDLAPGVPVELATHGGGLAEAARELERHPGLEVFVSRPVSAGGRLPRAVHSLLLPPGEPPARTAARFLAARAAGYRRFNLLPAYFTPWSPAELAGLRAAFAAVARAARALADRGAPVEIVNPGRRGSTPLCNDGLIVDADGEVYASNLALAAAVAPRRGLLRLGSVFAPDRLRSAPAASPARVLEDSFPPGIAAATRAADAALSEFCAGLAGGRG